jgi:hypothetical protein
MHKCLHKPHTFFKTVKNGSKVCIYLNFAIGLKYYIDI